jgi:hypothetical protein
MNSVGSIAWKHQRMVYCIQPLKLKICFQIHLVPTATFRDRGAWAIDAIDRAL